MELPFGYYHQIIGEGVANVVVVEFCHQVIDVQCKEGGAENCTLWDTYVHIDDIVPDLGPSVV